MQFQHGKSVEKFPKSANNTLRIAAPKHTLNRGETTEVSEESEGKKQYGGSDICGICKMLFGSVLEPEGSKIDRKARKRLSGGGVGSDLSNSKSSSSNFYPSLDPFISTEKWANGGKVRYYPTESTSNIASNRRVVPSSSFSRRFYGRSPFEDDDALGEKVMVPLMRTLLLPLRIVASGAKAAAEMSTNERSHGVELPVRQRKIDAIGVDEQKRPRQYAVKQQLMGAEAEALPPPMFVVPPRQPTNHRPDPMIGTQNADVLDDAMIEGKWALGALSPNERRENKQLGIGGKEKAENSSTKEGKKTANNNENDTAAEHSHTTSVPLPATRDGSLVPKSSEAGVEISKQPSSEEFGSTNRTIGGSSADKANSKQRSSATAKKKALSDGIARQRQRSGVGSGREAVERILGPHFGAEEDDADFGGTLGGIVNAYNGVFERTAMELASLIGDDSDENEKGKGGWIRRH